MSSAAIVEDHSLDLVPMAAVSLAGGGGGGGGGGLEDLPGLPAGAGLSRPQAWLSAGGAAVGGAVVAFDQPSATGHEDAAERFLPATPWQLRHQPVFHLDSFFLPTGSQATAAAEAAGATGRRSRGLQLRSQLVAFAEAIATDDWQRAKFLLSLLKREAQPSGDASQRTAYLFVEALKERIGFGEGSALIAAGSGPRPPPKELGAAIGAVCDALPFVRFAHMSAGVAMLDALRSDRYVHILDLSSWQGGQWESVIRAFAARPQGPPRLRITVLPCSPDANFNKPPRMAYEEMQRQLSLLAASLAVPFEYRILGGALEDLRPETLALEPGEALAVNAVIRLHTVPDEKVLHSNPRAKVLRLLRSLNPTILVVVEKHSNGSSPFFLQRFQQSLDAMQVVMAAVDSFMPRTSKDRYVFEKHALGAEIMNLVAYEGLQRTRRTEYLPKWQSRLRESGFCSRPFSPAALREVKALVEQFTGTEVKDQGGALMLSYKDFPIMHATAWQPAF
eukprot:SM000053S17476  [mRNA]  locus=s53:670204:672357:+ [translate_table: standard]